MNGAYRHYKGGIYEVVGTCMDCETLKTKVLYQSVVYGTLWVRDLEDFMATVTKDDGIAVPRFIKLND